MDFSCSSLEAGIRCTQVGYPLAHCLEGFFDRTSADRFVFLSEHSVLESEDQQVGELGVVAADITEGNMAAVLLAEGVPDSEDLGLGVSTLGSTGIGGDVERNAESS